MVVEHITQELQESDQIKHWSWKRKWRFRINIGLKCYSLSASGEVTHQNVIRAPLLFGEFMERSNSYKSNINAPHINLHTGVHKSEQKLPSSEFHYWKTDPAVTKTFWRITREEWIIRNCHNFVLLMPYSFNPSTWKLHFKKPLEIKSYVKAAARYCCRNCILTLKLTALQALKLEE